MWISESPVVRGDIWSMQPCRAVHDIPGEELGSISIHNFLTFHRNWENVFLDLVNLTVNEPKYVHCM
jgi:hypothetical protein